MAEYPIDSRVVCLRDFFDGNREKSVIKTDEGSHYIIPYYQRPYEWGWDDKQLKGMVNSFINTDFIEADDLSKDCFNYNADDYVIFGTIQINKNNGYEIIDGQQRLFSFWLFLCAIDEKCGHHSEDTLSFVVENLIAKKYQDQFDSFANPEEKDNQYAKNYYMHLLPVLNGISDIEKLKLLREYLLDKVLFSLMITSYEGMVDKTIRLFDTLNTKGLDLGTKDIFKIKYYEFLKNSLGKDYSEEKAKEIFNEINGAYEKCNDSELIPMFRKGEETLIDTFKLWITLNDKNYQNKLADKIKASSNKFFVDKQFAVWAEPLLQENDSRSLESFSSIADTISQTLKIMQRINACPKKNKDELKNPIRLCADELLVNCGYWYFRNLFYVFTHAIRMKKEGKDLSEGDVNKALSLCEVIWKVCSVVKTRDQKVQNWCFKRIVEKVAIKFLENPESEKMNLPYKDILSEDCKDYKDVFMETIEGKNGRWVFESRMSWFLVVLSYLRDCNNVDSFNEQRKVLFHSSRKERYEIEHIASKSLCDERYANRLGNLVFLTNGINSALGVKTKKLKEKTTEIESEEALITDFYGKVNPKSDAKNYLTDQDNNPAIKTFLDEYCKLSNEITVKDIYGIVQKRDDELRKYIVELYKDVLER